MNQNKKTDKKILTDDITLIATASTRFLLIPAIIGPPHIVDIKSLFTFSITDPPISSISK